MTRCALVLSLAIALLPLPLGCAWIAGISGDATLATRSPDADADAPDAADAGDSDGNRYDGGD